MVLNNADILSVLEAVKGYLIALGFVIFIAVFAIIFAGRAKPHLRKLIRSQSLIGLLLAVMVIADLILTGTLSAMMSHVVSTGSLTDKSSNEALLVSRQIADEGIVLLQNNDSLLPLAEGTGLNVFGWASINPFYSGEGSGALSYKLKKTSLLEGLENNGFSLNGELYDFYEKYRKYRPDMINSFGKGYTFDWTLPEPVASSYSEELLQRAKSFSDKAMIVIARGGGEETDLPKDMLEPVKKGEYIGNSSEYLDFPEGTHYLQLSRTEKDMVELVCRNFEDVVLVYNGANPFELEFIREYPQIKSVLWCPAPGQNGFDSLGAIMSGRVNPSGKTTDLFPLHLKNSPSYNNCASFYYENMYEFVASYHDVATIPSMVNYNEGIYVGYRFYETAYEEGIIDYDSLVMYPFGYGLSYTEFSKEMGELSYESGNITFDVKVTNTGTVPGKDVVEIYYKPPYNNGGIEKASANLIAFEKTDLIAPGESGKLRFNISPEYMASYDEGGDGCYVLESGDYEISLRSDSHNVIDSKTYHQDNTIVYGSDNLRATDIIPVTNRFEDAGGDVTYLSRKDHFANYWEAVAAPTDHNLPDEYKERFVNNSNYDPKKYDDPEDEMPKQGIEGDLTIYDMAGLTRDDPKWEQLLDQMSIEDMNQLVSLGFGTPAIESIKKPAIVENDGPAGVKNYTESSVGFPCETMIANTFNLELAKAFGDSIGTMATELGVTGWFAPAMNIHRNAFQGRLYEYYSEDPLLSGLMAAEVVKSAQDHGIYACIKHFALNEQDTNRNSMLCTWANEQSIREIYLLPFELAVKNGRAKAVMSSFNYIGTTWAGAYSPLLVDVLRNEWGFDGFVVTDYFGDEGNGYLNAEQSLRNGGDIMLIMIDTYYNRINNLSATGVKLLRKASKNYLYILANTYTIAGGGTGKTADNWVRILICCNAIVGVVTVILEILCIRNFLKRKKALAEE